jgi:hypothetical protein
MDAHRFDALTRALTATRSRRSLGRLLGGLSLGGVLAALGATEALAAKRNGGAPCTKGSQCKTGKCLRRTCSCSAKFPNCQRSSQFCSAGVCRLRCGAGGVCRVFVTSNLHQGNFGGLLAADNICNSQAQAAGLPGMYMAWLSDSSGSPDSRFMKSTGPYLLPNGDKVADDYADLTSGALHNPINVTASNEAPDPNRTGVWTNTSADGTQNDANNDCEDWTSDDNVDSGGAGNYGVSENSSWTQDTLPQCGGGLGSSLYCFQQS